MYIVRQNNIAVATCTGEYDLPRWSALMRDLNDHDCAALINLNDCQDTLTEIEAYLLALQSDELSRLQNHRMALVAPANPPGCPAFLAICYKNRGIETEVFETDSSALAWIGRE